MLSKIKSVSDDGYARLTGVVRNNCSISAGIQLKWTAFNKDGSVAFSQDFWPAHTTNIAPSSDYPFEMMNSAPRGSGWKFDVTPISITSW